MKILRILILIVGLVVLTKAQQSGLNGTVYDLNGAIFPEAKITAINKKGEKFITKTDGQGKYHLDLPAGCQKRNCFNFKILEYDLVVEAEDFEKYLVKEYKFNGNMHLNFALDTVKPISVHVASIHFLNLKEKL